MFEKILIANRGPIATRVVRTCRDMGIATVALYEKPDRGSLHVRLADEAIEVKSEHGYRDAQAILEAARKTRAQAVHPGYGFLAERPDFIDACTEAGLVFIGPSAPTVARLQCKNDALAEARAAGFVTTEFSSRAYGPGELTELRAEAAHLGYPLIIKSCAGGRGRGERMVRSPRRLDEAVRWAQTQAQAVYGDTLIYLERAIPEAHIIAVQILGDHYGHLVHLGEREGSAQLGNQTWLEEAPAPCLSAGQRERICATALDLARMFGCRNAVSVEFLVDAAGDYYFSEIKPRIQIEHPVTEMVTGVDLVREQICIAAGEPLSFDQDGVHPQGWAILARIAAEDPWNDFLPSPGYLSRVRLPAGPHVRVDTYVYSRYEVPARYDPMLAKLTVWGKDRPACLARLRRALQDFTLIGVPTNLPYHQQAVEQPDFVQGRYSTAFLSRPLLATFVDETYLRDLAVAAAIAFAQRNLTFRPSLPERINSGWHRSSRQLPD